MRALLQLKRRCSRLTGDTTALIQALPVDQLEALAGWLTAYGSNLA